MSDFKFTLKGAKALEDALRELPIKYERQVAKNALRAGGRSMRDEAKRLVPVDSGDLKKSIRIVTAKGKIPRVFVTAGGKGKGFDAFYAHMVEYGAAPHSVAKGGGTIAGRFAARHGGGKPHPGSPPQAFMRPALDVKGGEAIKRIAEVTAKGIERLAKK